MAYLYNLRRTEIPGREFDVIRSRESQFGESQVRGRGWHRGQ
jgi:hypothetical protein